MQTPEIFYLVTTRFPTLGNTWGATGDPVEDRDEAFNQYADAKQDGQPNTVAFRCETRGDGTWSMVDISAEFDAEIAPEEVVFDRLGEAYDRARERYLSRL